MYTYFNDTVRKKICVDTVIFVSASVHKAPVDIYDFHPPLYYMFSVLSQHLRYLGLLVGWLTPSFLKD